MGTTSKSQPADQYAASFLRLIDRDIQRNPQNIRPFDEALSHEVATLVDGVVVDKDEDLGPAMVGKAQQAQKKSGSSKISNGCTVNHG